MTPPVIGRIAIGKVVERNGKRLPEKDDEFTITTQVQNRAGWVLHPMDAALRLLLANSVESANASGLSAREANQLPKSGPPPAKASLTYTATSVSWGYAPSPLPSYVKARW